MFFFDVKGRSVFYLPYFSHPSPLVKRKSGFLAPNYFQTHFFGLGLDVPYYYPIDDYQDLTIIPKFSQKKIQLCFLNIEKTSKMVNWKVNLVGQLKIKEINQLKENKKRGHIKTKGSFDLNENTYFDFQVHRTTDRNYLNTYKYNYRDTLETNVKLESLRANNYYSFQSYLFQDLRQSLTEGIHQKFFQEFNSI